jgi:hypothetical protein
VSWLTVATGIEIPTAHGTLPGFVVPAGASFYRIYRRPDADWVPPPAQYRTGRVDPPSTDRGAYGLLYTADSMVTAGFEARIVRPVKDAAGHNDIEFVPELVDQVTGLPLKPAPMTAEHKTNQAVVFVDLESPAIAAASGVMIGSPVPRIARWRNLALWVYDELIVKGDGNAILPLIGMSYISTLQDCTGRNFAIFEERRDAHIVRGVPPSSQVPLDVAELQRLWASA